MHAAAGPASLIVPVSVRTGLAVGAATALAALLPIVHPSWVAIGAAAALQGGNAVLDLEKALQRAIGTFLGVAIVVLFLHDLSPGPWAIVVLVVAAVRRRADRHAPQPRGRRRVHHPGAAAPRRRRAARQPTSGDLAPTRLLDMLLGLGVGLFTSFVLWRRASTGRLPAALGRAIRAEALLLKPR
ncbi:FUSC family protein [Yinghuangia aomiensis]